MAKKDMAKQVVLHGEPLKPVVTAKQKPLGLIQSLLNHLDEQGKGVFPLRASNGRPYEVELPIYHGKLVMDAAIKVVNQELKAGAVPA